MRDHPCFNETCINEIKRLHLPVAQECNIHCNFCDKKITCAHVNKPGVTKRVLRSDEIEEYIKNIGESIGEEYTVEWKDAEPGTSESENK